MMDMPSEVTRRLSEDHVAWLTTVADSGAPAPNPVWFVQHRQLRIRPTRVRLTPT